MAEKKIVSKKADKESTKKATPVEPQAEVTPVADVIQIKEAKEEATPKVSKEEATAKAYARAMMEEMMPAFLAVARSAGGSAGAKEGTEHAEARIKRWQICNDCRQKGPRQPPCKAEGHTKMVVFPTTHPRFGPWFPGCIINGVRYLSNNRREKILVPTACVSQITKQIADFEENELQTMLGGRTAEHDSGEMNEGGGGKQKQAVSGWR